MAEKTPRSFDIIKTPKTTRQQLLPEVSAEAAQSKPDKVVSGGKRKGKKIIFLLLLIIFVTLFWLGYKAIANASKVVARHTGVSAAGLLEGIDATKLRGEGKGRINFLILGIGDVGHPGYTLSDTILVASLDPKTREVAVLSIPRDLYVQIPGFGGGKINAAHAFGEQNNIKGGGPALTKATLSSVLGIDIHYFIRVNFTGFKKVVDTVGGVDLVVEKALSDPGYPNDRTNGRTADPLYVPAGPKKFDGNLALKYARSRKTSNDFERATRQQELLFALKEKVVSLGTLTSPQKLSGIMDSIGGNMLTDVQLWEMEKIYKIVKDIDKTKIVTKVLDNSPNGLLKSQTGSGGAYILVPKSGNFNEIKKFINGFFTDSYLQSENAKIEIVNASGSTQKGQQVADILKSYKYNVIKVADSEIINQETQIVDHTSGGKPVTINFLQNRFGVNAVEKAGDRTDITVIIGSEYK